MTDPGTKVRSVLLVVLVVAGTIPAVSVGSVAAATTGNDAGNTPGDDPGNMPGNTPDTFTIQQAGQCYEMGSLGDGSQSVEEFYDYRSNETTPKSFNYSSYGTTHLQDNQQSKLFVYDGDEGYSLVVLHDKYALDGGNGSNASTVTFEMSGMGDGSWAVQDDTYGDDTQDDNWDIAGNTHDIDWKWGSNRTDGGAFSGIAGETITIAPGFNEEADAWDSWDYAGDDKHRIDEWRAIDGAGEYQLEQKLELSEDVTISNGTCSDAASPDADLTASPNPAANDETVTLDASGSTSENSDVSEYHWDFDGDGEIDEQTDDDTVKHTYGEPGDYEATVVVVDDNHRQDTASTTVEVANSSKPVVTVNAPDEVAAGHEFEVSADARKDRTIESYEWDFNGTTKSGQQVTHSYSEMGNHTVTLSWTAANGDTGTETVTIDAKVGTITYVNATTVEVTGEFERVTIHTKWYGTAGLAGETVTLDNVSGTTTYQVPATGINGSAIVDAAADRDTGDGEVNLSKVNPHDYDVRPESVNVSVESVTETGDGVYEVTFAYVNPNDERMGASASQFTTGNVDGEPPTMFYPGENTTAVTWTPESDDERVTWTVNQSNFDLADASASTKAASEYSDGGDDPPKDGEPTAKLSLDKQTAHQKVSFNASDSTDDGDIVEYRWDFDGDGEVDRTTPDNATDGSKSNDAHTVHQNIFAVYDEGGNHTAEVTVVDDAGNTDTATAKITIEHDNDTVPNATLDVPSEVTVDEEFTVEATDFTKDLEHVCWVFAENHDAPEDAVANHTFEETGEKKIELHLKDFAGNENTLTRWVEVTKADDGSGDDPNDDPHDGPDDDPDRGGLDDGDDRDSRTGGIPGVDPGDDPDNQDERPLEDQPDNVSANLTDGDDRIGNVVVTSDGTSDLTIEVHNTAPGGLPAPTPAADGFEAVSFLTVDGADSATLSVSKDRLDAMGATPEAVSLFRYENSTWTAVETTVANATDDAHQFRANVTSGTYAVGVERAAIAVADVTVRDQQVTPGESASVAVTVENDGLANGTQTVSLSVGGDAVATRDVSLPAGEWQTLRFAPTFASSGVYEVSVGDATAEVVVEDVETTSTTTTEASGPDEMTTDPTTTENGSTGIPGFGVGVSLVALLAAALLALRRR